MSLVKHNNNSISELTSSGSLTAGKMILLQTITASSSSTISFTLTPSTISGSLY